MKIHLAIWTDNIYGSMYSTLSAHKKIEHAEMAIMFHKEEQIKKNIDIYKNREEALDALKYHNWTVRTIELKDSWK